MRQHLDERGRRQHKRFTQYLFMIGLYVFLGAALVLAASLMEYKQEDVSTGSLENRFASTLTMELDGQTYHHYDQYYDTVLLIGIDEAKLEDAAVMRSGGQADFLLLLCIARNQKAITPIHIDRDTITDVQVFGVFGDPAGQAKMQICLAHAFTDDPHTNCANTAWAVSRLLGGIRVDHYLMMDMEGIAALNDALGGVTVTLEEDFSALDPAMTAGTTLKLQGKQAEHYVRGRRGVGDQSNLQRMSHQQQFIRGALDVLYGTLKKDNTYLVRLFETMEPHLCTSLDEEWVANQHYALEHYEVKDIEAVDGLHQVSEKGFMEFYPSEDDLQQLLADVFYVRH